MKGFFIAFSATFATCLISMWIFVVYDFGKIDTFDYQITKVHEQFFENCDLGDLDIIGDSTSVADILTTRISSAARGFGLGGGTPVETYYVAKSLLKCPNHPKAVILSFAPSSFGDNPIFPDPQKTFFWGHAVAYGVVDYGDMMDVLKYSRQFGSSLIIGPPSVLDLDYRVKAFLYLHKFPPYFLPSFKHYLISEADGGNKITQAENTAAYYQTIADQGHHFYGFQTNGGDVLDHDAYRTDDQISALTDFYLRRTIQTLLNNGIEVFIVEPPHDRTSAAHYPTGLVDIYQNYLLHLQSLSPKVHVIGTGLQVWDTNLFGDPLHLNLQSCMSQVSFPRVKQRLANHIGK